MTISMTDTITDLTDDELLRDFVSARSAEAFATLLGRHARMVRGVAFRLLGNTADTDDVLQEVFI
jgi:DNA-directed RNA polymerase specialized sigma24 family protein